MRTSYPYVERPVHVEPEGHRALAAAVIKMALTDLQWSQGRTADDLRSAVWLLEDRHGDLTAWCQVAGLDAQVVRERAARGRGAQLDTPEGNA